MRPIASLAAMVFAVVAFVHVIRLLYRWEVVINGMVMPAWTSVAGAIIAGSLAVLLWKESRKD